MSNELGGTLNKQDLRDPLSVGDEDAVCCEKNSQNLA
jgi:hypothetical protein